MKAKTAKTLGLVLGVLALVGGAVHVLQPLGTNLLTAVNLGAYTDWVQFATGVATIAVVLMKWKK